MNCRFLASSAAVAALLIAPLCAQNAKSKTAVPRADGHPDLS